MTPIEQIDALIEQVKVLIKMPGQVKITTTEYDIFHKEVTKFICEQELDETDQANKIYSKLIFGSNEILTLDEANYILRSLNDLRVLVLIKERKKKNKFDVFVSHASADKDSFVNQLAVELTNITSDVWYDKNIIKWGNDIKEKIKYGLEHCEFGIVVFSKSFVGRMWTETELKELLDKQNDNGKEVVLPILLDDLSVDEFKKAYPSLEYTRFLKQSEHKIHEIAIMFANRLIERLKGKE